MKESFVIVLFLFSFIFISCEKIDDNLISKDAKIETKSSIIELDNPERANTGPVYRYYHWSGDHLYTTMAPVNGGIMSKGKFYKFEYIEFYTNYTNVLNDIGQIISYQCFYSSVLQKYAYYKYPTYDFDREANGTEVYAMICPQVGSMPLKEYYIPSINAYHLVSSFNEEIYMAQNMPGNYVFKRHLGYVYPGRNDDEYRPDTKIKICNKTTIPNFTRYLTVYVKEKTSPGVFVDKRLSYKLNNFDNFNQVINITIPKKYWVISAYITSNSNPSPSVDKNIFSNDMINGMYKYLENNLVFDRTLYDGFNIEVSLMHPF